MAEPKRTSRTQGDSWWAGARLVSGALLVVIAFVSLQVALSLGGFVIPEEPNSHATLFYVDEDAGLVGIRLAVNNTGPRDLRLTSVALDAPGEEVVRVDVVNSYGDVPVSTTTGTSTVTDGVVASTARDHVQNVSDIPRDTVALPLLLSSTGFAVEDVVIWFRPTECDETAGRWGFVELTVDFGAGSFPPISRTFRDDKPIWAGGSVTLWDGETFFKGDRPLALACELVESD